MTPQSPLIQTVGLFWKRGDVFWGQGGRGNRGALLGRPASSVRSRPVDFRQQSGIYVLYSGYDIVYAGQTGSGNQKLLSRLNEHRKDDLAERWDRFSWFGLRRAINRGNGLSVDTATRPTSSRIVLNHIEAILIHSTEPSLNRQGGRFGKKVTRYLQVRDERLGPTAEEMVREMWESSE